jgi:hypothetical protein
MSDLYRSNASYRVTTATYRNLLIRIPTTLLARVVPVLRMKRR